MSCPPPLHWAVVTGSRCSSDGECAASVRVRGSGGSRHLLGLRRHRGHGARTQSGFSLPSPTSHRPFPKSLHLLHFCNGHVFDALSYGNRV